MASRVRVATFAGVSVLVLVMEEQLMKRQLPPDGVWLEARISKESFDVLALGRCLPFCWDATGDPDWVRVYVRAPGWWVGAIVASHPDLFRWPEKRKRG